MAKAPAQVPGDRAQAGDPVPAVRVPAVRAPGDREKAVQVRAARAQAGGPVPAAAEEDPGKHRVGNPVPFHAFGHRLPRILSLQISVFPLSRHCEPGSAGRNLLGHQHAFCDHTPSSFVYPVKAERRRMIS